MSVAAAAVNHQRRALPCDPQCGGSVVAGKDAPQAIAVGVVVQAACQAVHVGHKVPARLVRFGDETGVAGEFLAQSDQGFIHRFVVDDQRAMMALPQGLDHRFPGRVGQRGFRHDRAVAIGRHGPHRRQEREDRQPCREDRQSMAQCRANGFSRGISRVFRRVFSPADAVGLLGPR